VDDVSVGVFSAGAFFVVALSGAASAVTVLLIVAGACCFRSSRGRGRVSRAAVDDVA
jgi:hypothetical protein